MYRYMLRESCSQFDSLPLTSLTIPLSKERGRVSDVRVRRSRARAVRPRERAIAMHPMGVVANDVSTSRYFEGAVLCARAVHLSFVRALACSLVLVTTTK